MTSFSYKVLWLPTWALNLTSASCQLWRPMISHVIAVCLMGYSFCDLGFNEVIAYTSLNMNDTWNTVNTAFI